MKPYSMLYFGDTFDENDEVIYCYDAFKISFLKDYQFKDFKLIETLELEYNTVYNAIRSRILRTEYTDIPDAQILGVQPFESTFTEEVYLIKNGFRTLTYSSLFVKDHQKYKQYKEAIIKTAQAKIDGTYKPELWMSTTGKRTEKSLLRLIDELNQFDQNKDFHFEKQKDWILFLWLDQLAI